MSFLAQQTVPIVAAEHFVLATRDTGYRSVAAAIAELIDNSLQANARRIDVLVREAEDGHGRSVVLGVLDEGSGMSPATLECALQFGGTNRFDDRSGLGRFGMGLPNSSVSHSRRLEVYSWKRPSEIYYSYLDVDEVAAGHLRFIPKPRRSSLPLGWLHRPAGPARWCCGRAVIVWAAIGSRRWSAEWKPRSVASTATRYGVARESRSTALWFSRSTRCSCMTRHLFEGRDLRCPSSVRDQWRRWPIGDRGSVFGAACSAMASLARRGEEAKGRGWWRRYLDRPCGTRDRLRLASPWQ